VIETFADDCLQPASYDFRVGVRRWSVVQTELVDVENRRLVVLDSGEFAVVATFERVACGPLPGRLLDCTFVKLAKRVD
jgi:deoxycytidine triphosphate deaminase